MIFSIQISLEKTSEAVEGQKVCRATHILDVQKEYVH